jgi:hypothetical protein
MEDFRILDIAVVWMSVLAESSGTHSRGGRSSRGEGLCVGGRRTVRYDRGACNRGEKRSIG